MVMFHRRAIDFHFGGHRLAHRPEQGIGEQLAKLRLPKIAGAAERGVKDSSLPVVADPRHRLRLVADRTLANLYRSGQIDAIYDTWFGGFGQRLEAYDMMIQLNAIPE